MNEITARGREMMDALPTDVQVWRDASARRKFGTHINPMVRHIFDLIDKLSPLTCSGDMSAMKTSYEPFLIVFGDEAFIDQMNDASKKSDERAADAQLCLANADSILALDDKVKAQDAARKIMDVSSRWPASDRATISLLRIMDDARLSFATRTKVRSLLLTSKSGTALGIRRVLTTQPAS